MKQLLTITSNYYTLTKLIGVFLLWLAPIVALGQGSKVVIQGTVLDNNKEPLTGATIRIVGTKTGTVSGEEGRFLLHCTKKWPIELQVSFVGMTTQTLKVTDSKPLTILLQNNANLLTEVVATGMQKIKKYQLTGSAAVVTAKELTSQGLGDIDRLLEGMVPGLNSTTLSGAPGVRAQIMIRGNNTLNGNTEPLWIIDGLPVTQGVPKNNSGNYAETIMEDGIGNIMPEDIESISILKDASAAAIYGARAANGVIVITTKRGFRSKTLIHYTGSYELSTAPSVNLGMMSSPEKLAYEQSLLDNFGTSVTPYLGRAALFTNLQSGYITPEAYEHEMNRLRNTNTQWLNVIFRTAHSHKHNLNIQGGSDKFTYYTSLNHTDKYGILSSNRYTNTGVVVKLDYRPTDKLIIGADFVGNTRTNKNHASAIDPFKYAVFANPYEQPYKEDGTYAADLSYLGNNRSPLTPSGYIYNELNILKELHNTASKQTALDAEAKLNIQYEPLKGLMLRIDVKRSLGYGYESQEIDAGTYTSWISEQLARAAYPDAQVLPKEYDNGELHELANRSDSWTGHAQVDYSTEFGKKHFLTLFGAIDFMDRAFNNFGTTFPIYYADYRITGLPQFGSSDILYSKLYDQLKNLQKTSDGQDRSLSYIANLRYEYDRRYILNLNARLDGADVIGNKNQFTPLWSVGGRYNLHNEPFFSSSFINEFVLRASYGFTGLIDRSAYPFSVIEIGDLIYDGHRIVKNYQYPNPTVRWAKKQDFNAGVEISLWNNRLSLTSDVYSNRTEDLLTQLQVPISTGRKEVMANGGIMQNKGIELGVNVRWIESNDWHLSSRFNISLNNNKIIRSRHDFASYQELLDNGNVILGGVFNIQGEETNAVYGWKTAGIDPRNGLPRYYLSEAGKKEYEKILQQLPNMSTEEQEHYQRVLPSTKQVMDYVAFDYNNDGKKDPWQMPSLQYLGRLTPKYVGGFSTSLRYKGLEISTLWSFKMGHLVPTFNDYQNAPRTLVGRPTLFLDMGYTGDIAVSGTNRQREYLNYWKNVGDQTNIRQFAPAGNNDLWASLYTSDKYQRGDYLRLNNLAITYQFDRTKTQKLGLNNLGISLNARNLFTLTSYKGIDVATGNAFGYPVAREFSVKLMFGL